jgi:hypothetical protein
MAASRRYLLTAAATATSISSAIASGAARLTNLITTISSSVDSLGIA